MRRTPGVPALVGSVLGFLSTVACLLLPGPGLALVLLETLDVAAIDVVHRNGLVLVADYRSGLRVYELDRGEMREVGRFEAGIGQAVAVDGSTAYYAELRGGVWILDVSDPTRPEPLGFLDVRASAIEVSGGRAYIASEGGLRVFDVSDPSRPRPLGGVPDVRSVRGLAVVGSVVHVAAGFDGLRIFDLSIPSEPVELASLDEGGDYSAVAVRDGVAYLAVNRDLLTLDVSDPRRPSLVSTLESQGYIADLELAGGLLYAVSWGLAVFDVSRPGHPVPLGSLSSPGGPPVALALHDRVALVANRGKLRVVDLTWPRTPRRVASPVPAHAEAIGVSGSRVYVASGLRVDVLDFSIPTAPEVLGTIETRFVRRIELSGDRAYLLDRNGELGIWDVSDLRAPLALGSVDLDTRFSVKALEVRGEEAFVGAPGRGLIIIDVSDPREPTIVSEVPLGVADIDVRAGIAYVTSRKGGLHIVDVSDPGAPVPLANLKTSNALMISTALYDEVAFVLDFVGVIRVVDVSDPAHPFATDAWIAVGGSGDGELHMDGELLFAPVTEAQKVLAIDVSDPSSPQMLGGHSPFASGTGRFEVSRGVAFMVDFDFPIVDFGPDFRPRKPVAIDVAPRDPFDVVRLWKPLLEVAVLGSEDFDPAGRGTSSLRLGPHLASPVGLRPGRELDVDRDGFPDLLSQFRIRETGIAAGDTRVCLRGLTADGREIRGCDEISVRGCDAGFATAAGVLPALGLRRGRRHRSTRGQ